MEAPCFQAHVWFLWVQALAHAFEHLVIKSILSSFMVSKNLYLSFAPVSIHQPQTLIPTFLLSLEADRLHMMFRYFLNKTS